MSGFDLIIHLATVTLVSRARLQNYAQRCISNSGKKCVLIQKIRDRNLSFGLFGLAKDKRRCVSVWFATALKGDEALT